MKAPRKSPDLAHGAKFEAITHGIFDPLCQKYPAKWERVLDSKAAGNLIRAARSDFLLHIATSLPGTPFVFSVECKASIKHTTLAECFRSALRQSQVPLARLDSRAGICVLYIFHSVENQEVEIWYGPDLYEPYYAAKTKLRAKPLQVFSMDFYRQFGENLVSNPLKFLNAIPTRGTPCENRHLL